MTDRPPLALLVLDDHGDCSVQCGGRCCEDFPINISPDRIALEYADAHAHIVANEERRGDWDCITVAEMVIRIDEPDEAKPRYTCRHLDRPTGLCTIYDRRPAMCSQFPDYGWGGACHICGIRAERAPLPNGSAIDPNFVAPQTSGWRSCVDWLRTRTIARLARTA